MGILAESAKICSSKKWSNLQKFPCNSYIFLSHKKCLHIFKETKIFLTSKLISTCLILLTILSYCRNIFKMFSTAKTNSCQIYEQCLSTKIYTLRYAWKIHPKKYISTKEASFTVVVIKPTEDFITYATNSQYLFCKFCIFWLM